MDKLLPRHLSDLSKSTLTDETITKYGIKSLTAAEVCQQLNRNDIDCGGYLIPYPHGSSYFKIKLDKPLADCKYLSPKGMSSDIFITYLAQEKQNDITFPLYFAEGEKKSMAMERLGFAAISVPGVYGWKSRGHIQEGIANLLLKGRTCYIVFDTDKKYNRHVRKAEFDFANVLHELGAVVKIVNLQYVLGGKAIDDQIAYFKQCGNLGDLKSYYFDNAEDYENYVIRYKKREKGIESETDKINVSDYPEEEIKDIVLDIRNGRAKNFIIRKRLSSFIINDMKQRGVFIYTEIEPLYFYNKTKKLLRFTNDNRLAALINDLYGLNASEKEYDYLIKEMESEVINRGNRILIRQFSHYDKNKNKLYISKFNGQMYVLDGKEVSLEDNGYDGVLFFDRPEWEPYEYRGDLTSDKEIEAKIIDPINFNTSQQKGLTPKEQGLLLLIHIYSLFFGSIQPTRPICAFIGPKGSGKSSADMRRLLWLFGSNIQVLRIPDKKDGFIATVTNRHHFVVFDNVDSSLKWLNDFLAMIATGGKFAMRILYTTNQEEQHSVDIFLSLNARTPKFRRDDVADRLLLFYLERLAKFIPEIKLRQDISQSRDLLWSDIINRLNRLLHFLSTSTDELKDNPYRMADFADLGWRIAKSINREEEFLRILNKMQAKQSEFSAEQDPLFYLIDIWLEDKPGQCSGALLVKDLFSELKEVAEKHKLPFYYKSPMSLALTISNILLDLKTHFDIKEKDMPSNERFYTFSKKNNYGIPLQEEDLTGDIHEPDRGYSNDEQ